MASTFSNLGIELIGTGEQAGSWGTTTNDNLDDIIDNAIVGYVKVTLIAAGSSGSPNTLNVAPGAASDGQKRVIEVYSAADLGGDVYLQITPVTFFGYYFIRNSLAGSRSLRIFQGTYSVGNTVLLANGYDAVIRCDGAATPIVSLVLSNIQGTVLNATNTAITNDAATAVAVYPTWVTANTGNLPQKTTSASLSFVPSTGVFSATSFSGAGTGLTGTAASLTAGTATNATNTAITNDAATAVSVYPTWVTANTGNLPQKTTSASFSFIPSSGTLVTRAISLSTSASTSAYIYSNQSITGTYLRSVSMQPTIQSDITGTASGYLISFGTTTSTAVNNVYGYVYNDVTITGAATVSTAAGFYVGQMLNASFNYGVYVNSGGTVGTGKTAYGVYSTLNSASGATVYNFAAAGTAPNVFNGNTTIGTAAGTASGCALNVQGSIAVAKPPSTITTSSYTVLDSDFSLRFSTTNCTVLLPIASSFPGRILHLITTTSANSVVSASANVVPLGSATAGTAILAAATGKFAMIQSDGSNWITLMAN